jgi:hypothetical protein
MRPQLKADLDSAARDAADCSKRAGRARSQAEAAKGADGRLGAGRAQFEALEELIGRIVSYAGLVYAGDTSDPQRAKLYGDVQEKMTDASAHLLFFTLELNQIDDKLDRTSALDADPGLSATTGPGCSTCARTSLTSSTTASSSFSIEKSMTGRCRLEPAVRRDDEPSCASISTASG